MSDLFKLGEKLSAAIQAGDTNTAVSLATMLATMKLKVDVNINKDEIEQRNRENEFSVRVHIEDRLSDGFYLNLQVKSCDTIQDLKRKVMLKHGFPEEVQRWIIGKKLPDDDNKLSQCGIKGPGHTLFLYLVTARSVGLAKQDFEARRQAMFRGILYPLKLPNQPGPQSPAQRESSEPYGHVPLSPQETESQNVQINISPILSPSSDTGMGEVDQGHYGPARQTSKKSLTSGSSIIQEMLMAPNLSSLPTGDSRHKPVPVEGSESEIEFWESGFESRPSRPQAAHRLRTPPPPQVEKIGWVCTTCTFINLPIRPGCEMCTGPRPSGYKIPAGYQITAEERMLLENDQLLEKMTREAQPADENVPRAPPRPNHHRVTYEQLQENLHLIDAISARSNENNNSVNHRNSSDNNQVVGNNYVLIPGGEDWVNMQEIPERPAMYIEPRHRTPLRLRGYDSIAAPPPIEAQQAHYPPSRTHSPHRAALDRRYTQDFNDVYFDVTPDDDFD